MRKGTILTVIVLVVVLLLFLLSFSSNPPTDNPREQHLSFIYQGYQEML